MPTARRLARGAALTALAVALAGLAHVAAGAEVPEPGRLGVLALVLLPGACAWTRVRVLPGVVALGAVQVAAHALLSAGPPAGHTGTWHTVAGHVPHDVGAGAVGGVVVGTSVPMLPAHVLAVVLTVLAVAARDRAAAWCAAAWAWVQASLDPPHAPAPPGRVRITCTPSPVRPLHLRDVPPGRGPPVVLPARPAATRTSTSWCRCRAPPTP